MGNIPVRDVYCFSLVLGLTNIRVRYLFSAGAVDGKLEMVVSGSRGSCKKISLPFKTSIQLPVKVVFLGLPRRDGRRITATGRRAVGILGPAWAVSPVVLLWRWS